MPRRANRVARRSTQLRVDASRKKAEKKEGHLRLREDRHRRAAAAATARRPHQLRRDGDLGAALRLERNRNNEGRPGDAGTFAPEGVYTGAFGARFERDRVMEYSHMVVTPQQNTASHGYGAKATGRRADILRLWAEFYGRQHLPNWKEAQEGTGGFEKIGTDEQRPPLLLDDLIRYDEMAISALLSVSTRTPLYNDGSRKNEGRPGDAGTFAPEGVYTGVVGARFERHRVMEYSHMVVTAQQEVSNLRSRMEIRKFFGASFNAASTKTSAVHLPQRYVDMLDFDILPRCDDCGARGHEYYACAQMNLDQRFLMAAEKGDGSAVRHLCLEGASADGRDQFGDTALCSAVIKGRERVVETLLQCHASPNARCSSGDTPLMYAVHYGHQNIVEALLDGRASVDLKCRAKTALMHAMHNRYSRERIRGVESLLSHRASVNVTDNAGLTPLMVAVQFDDWTEDVVLALLEAGSSCNHRVKGQNAKDLASQTHRADIETYEQERLMLLTLHVSVAEPGASFAFTCTNIGGDELASGIAELQLPVATLYAKIAAELQSEHFCLILPDGQLLENDARILGEALAEPLRPVKPIQQTPWQV